MNFEINQIFSGEYPPEAAIFCNENNLVIVELESQDNQRRFQIQQTLSLTDEEIASQIRAERNVKLSETDYLMLTDSILTAEQNTAFVEYRQALRDVTAQTGFPNNIVWPTKPAL